MSEKAFLIYCLAPFAFSASLTAAAHHFMEDSPGSLNPTAMLGQLVREDIVTEVRTIVLGADPEVLSPFEHVEQHHKVFQIIDERHIPYLTASIVQEAINGAWSCATHPDKKKPEYCYGAVDEKNL